MSRPPEHAIRARGLSKTYRLYARPIDRLIEALTGRPRHRAHQALADVSFDVARGEAFGIIGENGAGKSTLLQLLAGISPPTAGAVTIEGRVASILELGWGFHPEMTGRQNLVISAAMLGLSERDVRDTTGEILDFAELGSAIDDPVRTYSTGMAMRLAFAIAIAVAPAVLLVDEALAVGDGHFQRKCLDRIRAFITGGGSLVFSSHAMYFVAELCPRALWLRDGRAEALGPAADVIRQYEGFLVTKHVDVGTTPVTTTVSPARIVDVRPPAAATVVAAGQAWSLDIECEADDAGLALHVAVGIDRADGVQIWAGSTKHDGRQPLSGAARYLVRLTFPALPLLQGSFTAYVALLDEAALHLYDRRVVRQALDVRAEDYRVGLVALEHRWQVDQNRSLSPQV